MSVTGGWHAVRFDSHTLPRHGPAGAVPPRGYFFFGCCWAFSILAHESRTVTARLNTRAAERPGRGGLLLLRAGSQGRGGEGDNGQQDRGGAAEARSVHGGSTG